MTFWAIFVCISLRFVSGSAAVGSLVSSLNPPFVVLNGEHKALVCLQSLTGIKLRYIK